MNTSKPAGRRRRILCVEDDRDTAALLCEELVERGFDVDAVYNGRDALNAILREPPDLVLSDVGMPGMSGFELLDRLTSMEPRFERMPFVFLTALGDHDSEIRGWHLGADDYLTKPVDYDVLAALIAARLSRVARSAIWPQRVALREREVEALTWAARGKTFAEIDLEPEQAHRGVPSRERPPQTRRPHPHAGVDQGGDRKSHPSLTD
jgi:DNA-binding response OmpR family regulator